MASTLAVIGGLILVGIAIMTGVSVAGRALTPLGLRPVPGDFELVEAGTALAVFCFLPIAHVRHAHARVDLLTDWLPQAFNRWINRISDVMFAGLMAFVALRLLAGTADKMRFGETTFILQFPLWWSYSVATALAFVACFVSCAVTIRDWNRSGGAGA